MAEHSAPKPMKPETQALLRRPNFAHLATIREDGSPKLDPIWIDLVDEINRWTYRPMRRFAPLDVAKAGPIEGAR